MVLRLSLFAMLILTVCLFLGESYPGRAAAPAEIAVVYGGAPQCAKWKSTYLTYCSSVCGSAIAKSFSIDKQEITSVDTLMCDSVSTCTSLMPSGDVCSGG